ncbi:unnamed protein product [Cercopithifilaria johnstoni]|uniref:Tudor domain-containing protein n=1 Tax=Cercopithifilaria johnstoni TaxID=2874296 RepID=A0A8J2MTR0_9BILA|nr:unnamed protein product [Cercopithifilaria johnstoni]
MVVMSLPFTVPDFEGEISHVTVAGSEALIFVKLTTWQREWEKINAKIRDLAPLLEEVTLFSGVKSGEVYIVKVKGSFERAFIIRRPMPEIYAVHLIDKGIQCEVELGEIYEYPSELLEFGVFNCVCPVLVPLLEDLSLYKSYVGYKCKCNVEIALKSLVVMGFVRGRFSIEIEGRYENLQDIILEKVKIGPGNSDFTFEPHWATEKHAGHIQAGQTDVSYSSSSSSESSYHNPCTQAGLKTNTNSALSFPGTRNFAIPKKEKLNFFIHNNICLNSIFFLAIYTAPEIVAGRDKAKVGTLFNQRAFLHYIPEMLPITLSVRFDKTDRVMSTFWVINKKILADVEKALREVGDRLSRFPPINQRGEDIQMRETPCIVRSRADNVYNSLFRAVPAQYDARTKRVSAFLVDFGWFKWVLASDVLDISSMEISNPVRNLPAAMIHCREDKTSMLHAKDLIKGTNCEMTIKGNALRDVYTVDLVEPLFMPNRIDGTSNEQPINGREATIGNMQEAEVISSCKKLVTETCQRQLMTSMMMETLSIASRELAQQPQNFWPAVYRPTFPMAMPVMMPMAFPVMFPMTMPNINLQSAGDNVAVRPENTEAGNFEGVNFSNKNSGARPGARGTNYRSPKTDHMRKGGIRFQGKSSQAAKEWPHTDFGAENEFSAFASDKNKTPQNSCEEGSSGLSWDLPPNSIKERRKFQKSLDNNAQKGRLTDWEKAVAADRAGRNQQDHNPSPFGGD